MSETQVSINFGGQTSEFEAACGRALAAMKALTDGVTSLTTGLTASTAGMNTATPAANAMATATNNAATAAKTLSPAVRAASADAVSATGAYKGWGDALRSAEQSAEVFRQALGDQTNEVKALKAQFDGAKTAATGAGHASGGVTRELIVLGHEAITGNFSRFGGSLIVMAELIGGISIKLIALGGAIAVAGIGAYHLYEHLKLAREEAESFAATSALLGRDPEAAAAAAKKLAAELRATDLVGSEAARHIAAGFLAIPGSTHEVGAALAKLVPMLHDAEKTTPIDEVAKAFLRQASSVAGIKKALEEKDAFQTVAQRLEMEGFVASNDLIGAQKFAIERLNARLGDQFSWLTKINNLWSMFSMQSNETAMAGAPGFPIPMPEGPAKPKVKLSEAAPSPAAARLDAEIAKANKEREEGIRLDDLISEMEERRKTTTDALARVQIDTAIRLREAERAALHERGDTSWMQKQEAALGKITNATVMSAKTSKEATEGKLAAEIKFWDETAHNAEFSVTQRAAAERKVTALVEQQKMAQLHAADAGAKTGTSVEIAELSAQQAAHRDDFTKWMELENQKLGILRAAYGERSLQFLSEKKAEEAYVREHAARMQAIELQTLIKREEIDQRALQTKIQGLAAQVAAQQMTKSEELALAYAYTVDEGQAEVAALDRHIKHLGQGTEELKKALLQREALVGRFDGKLATLEDQRAAEERRSADRRMATYANAFDRIGSTGERTVTGLIMGTTTWRQAQQQAAGAVLEGMVSVGGKILSNWAAVEVGKLISTRTGQQARSAIEMTGSGWSVIGHKIAEWIGLETAKTEATGVGAVTRTGIAAAADVATAGSAVAGATTAIVADASAAEAGAYAATAPIPYIGPILAVAAGAAALAAVLAMKPSGSFATGAWSLPSDMIAQVHKGEMIIPAGPAAAIRAGGGGNAPSGGGDGGGDTHFHINALDAGSFMALMRSNPRVLADTVSGHWQNNPSSRPRY